MLRDDGHLFLFFSGGGYLGTTYGMGVAVCGSISGPCRQQGDQPILSSTDAVAGPGAEPPSSIGTVIRGWPTRRGPHRSSAGIRERPGAFDSTVS